MKKILLFILFYFSLELYAWDKLVGEAKDIGIGANNSVWVIGTNSVNGGYGIYHWNGNTWNSVDGGAVRIDVDSRGNPWVVNSSGYIYQRVGGIWERRPGRARDIGIGANGSVWVIGTNSVSGGYGIYHWNGNAWNPTSGGATQVSVGNNGKPWVVNSLNHIYRR